MHAASDPQPNAADSAIEKREKIAQLKNWELFCSIRGFNLHFHHHLKWTLFNQRYSARGLLITTPIMRAFQNVPTSFVTRGCGTKFMACWKWDKCCQRTLCVRPKRNWGKKLFVNKLLLDDVQSVSHALAVIIIDTKSITHARCYIEVGGGRVFVNIQIRSQFRAYECQQQ